MYIPVSSGSMKRARSASQTGNDNHGTRATSDEWCRGDNEQPAMSTTAGASSSVGTWFSHGNKESRQKQQEQQQQREGEEVELPLRKRFKSSCCCHQYSNNTNCCCHRSAIDASHTLPIMAETQQNQLTYPFTAINTENHSCHYTELHANQLLQQVHNTMINGHHYPTNYHRSLLLNQFVSNGGGMSSIRHLLLHQNPNIVLDTIDFLLDVTEEN